MQLTLRDTHGNKIYELITENGLAAGGWNYVTGRLVNRREARQVYAECKKNARKISALRRQIEVEDLI